MNIVKYISSLLVLSLFPAWITASERIAFDQGWKFRIGKSLGWEVPSLDDSSWRTLDLPHDWAIEGDFHVQNPSGSVGGALPGGVGWYRKHFTIEDADGTTRYYIDFDGVFMNSSVYLNGHLLGTRPYGYVSFRYDLTPYLNKNGENVLAVCVDNSKQPNSRWYSGCGIYRHVYLVRKQNLHIANWGVFARAELQKHVAQIDVDVDLENHQRKPCPVHLCYSIIDANGKVVSQTKASFVAKVGKTTVCKKLSLRNPNLWSVDKPYLYNLKVEVLTEKSIVDKQDLSVGLRSFRFDSQTGFWLNGTNLKINGVCLHGDMGCLGTAVNEDAIHRQLSMLKEMGANAIRCAHNPPAPELLNMCDSMGLLVMDESFDSWLNGKTLFDYSKYFANWYERDLRDMVLRDRNHPSIIMWSIGNEVLEQWNTNRHETVSLDLVNIELNKKRDASLLSDIRESSNTTLTKKLVSIVKQMDGTRPVTAGCNEVSPQNHLFKSEALDVIGFNYHHQEVKNVPHDFPGKPFLLTESVSALQTRGYYVMPSDSIYCLPGKARPYMNPTFMCSAYDNMQTSWGSIHEATWDVVKHTPYCSGQFIWTGWDYIGEPTPFAFPARSSYFGIIDLAGFPKDVYYMYQSEWTDKDVLHLFPHWNWIEGQTVDLWCYYSNADEVELFINGVSKGVRKKGKHDYHVIWRVKYQPGEIRAVSRKNNKVVKESIIRTAGTPDHVRLVPNTTTLVADGRSLSFVTVEIVDKDGILCPLAENQVFFSLEGKAKIVGVDNGCQMSMERFQANHRKAFFGRCLVVIQADKETSTVTLSAKSVGLGAGIAKITVK